MNKLQILCVRSKIYLYQRRTKLIKNYVFTRSSRLNQTTNKRQKGKKGGDGDASRLRNRRPRVYTLDHLRNLKASSTLRVLGQPVLQLPRNCFLCKRASSACLSTSTAELCALTNGVRSVLGVQPGAP